MARLKQKTLFVASEVLPETVMRAQNALQALIDMSEDMDRDQRRCFLGLIFRGLGFVHAEMGMTADCLREMVEGPAERAELRASQMAKAAVSPKHKDSLTIH